MVKTRVVATSSFLFALVIFNAISIEAFPASSDSETELIDPKYGGKHQIVDTGFLSGSGSGFGFDLFQSMEDMMKRMRDQMNVLLNGFGSSKLNGTDIEQFPSFGFPQLPNVNLGKGNTTSVTKVIDGHKVVINETKYGEENANGGAFFRVKVIEVKPDDSENPTGSPRDVESVENLKESTENEIPNEGRDLIRRKLPTSALDVSSSWNELDDFNEGNHIEDRNTHQSHRKHWNKNNQRHQSNQKLQNEKQLQRTENNQLNQKTIINEVIKSRRFPLNRIPKFSETRGFERKPLYHLFGDVNPYASFLNDNGIERNPNDLSRDTFVNDVLKARGYSMNPEAEVFSDRSIVKNPLPEDFSSNRVQPELNGPYHDFPEDNREDDFFPKNDPFSNRIHPDVSDPTHDFRRDEMLDKIGHKFDILMK